MDIGFIGLGEMGTAMVANILKAGHNVRVWNRSPERAQRLVEAGARVVGSVAEAMSGFRYLSGEPGRPPVRVGISIGDAIAATQGFVGALMALFARDRPGGTNTGQLVDVAHINRAGGSFGFHRAAHILDSLRAGKHPG